MLRNAAIPILLAWVACAQAQSFVVAPDLWDRPRSAATVLGAPAVKQAVGAYLAQPEGRLVIRHGPGQESTLQAEELRSWLIALAVESRQITLQSDLKPGEGLRLDVQR